MKLPSTKRLIKQVGFELRIRRLSREDRRRLRSVVAGRQLN